MKFPYLYCGKICGECTDKMADGRCARTERLDTEERCPDSVLVQTPKVGFVIKYLYRIVNDAPRIISTTAKPMQTYPERLYCAKIEDHCPHQTPGGKCKLYENMPDAAPCKHEMFLDQEQELVVRYLQQLHKQKVK